MDKVLENSILEATQVIEDHIDETIDKIDNLDDKDFEAIQRKRASALKREMKMKEEWIAKGHGEYTTLTEEKEVFAVGKKSKNVVVHFYRDSTMRCSIVDKHLALLATKHIETKFCRVDVEKAPFLCDRLKIRVIPTIVLCKDSETIDYIIGFDDLGGIDDFSTEMMEWRLAKADVIDYEGDLDSPPDTSASVQTKVSFIKHVRKNIRGGACGSDSD